MSIQYRVVFTPEARDQLNDLHAYIAAAADPDTATDFTNGIIDHAATLSEFPHRATPRDDLRPGLRTTAWRRRVTIAYVVEEQDVVVIGVFYGGRDIENLISNN